VVPGIALGVDLLEAYTSSLHYPASIYYEGNMPPELAQERVVSSWYRVEASARSSLASVMIVPGAAYRSGPRTSRLVIGDPFQNHLKPAKEVIRSSGAPKRPGLVFD